MPKFLCENCNEAIEEPYVYHYREDLNGEGAFADFFVSVCPLCGSEELRKVEGYDSQRE